MNPRVQAVSVVDDHYLSLVFSNGETGYFDCQPFFSIGVFKELQNPEYFRLVKVVDGTVVWPHEQDFCPDTLYLERTTEL
jgi:hypothetical protein